MNKIEIVFNGQKIKGIWRDEVDESVWAEIFKWREYRRAEEVIQTDDLILDVGAHAGFFAIYCLALNAKAQVFCLEPEANNVKALKENLALNGWEKKVRITEAALTVISGKHKLEISVDSQNHRVVSEEYDGENFTEVSGVSLFDFVQKNKIKKIGLIKMDIEGGEYELLENWTADEYKMIKNIIFEYHESFDRRKEELIKILQENGFGVQIFPSKFDKTMGIIFANNKRIK